MTIQMDSIGWVREAKELYNEAWKNRDPRSDDFIGMSSPLYSILICVAYIPIVCWILPKFMQHRPAYDLRQFMMFYNFGMVLLSGYIWLEFALSGWLTGYTFGCQLVDYSNDPKAIRMLNVCWWFYASKFIELLDTVIFVLRKKNSQVTFLHVFHHSIMPASWWIAVRFAGGGFSTFHAWLNSFIHFMMYMYYGLAGLGPKYHKYLWWKKYMTKMQITQFVLCLVHCSQLLFLPDCPYPRIFCYWIFSYAAIFVVLFANFYRQTYNRNKAAAASKRQQQQKHEAANQQQNGLKKD